MRTLKELQDLALETSRHFEKDFDVPYDKVALMAALDSLCRDRMLHFAKRRLGHLLDNDLLRFRDALNDFVPAPLEVVKPPPKTKVNAKKG